MSVEKLKLINNKNSNLISIGEVLKIDDSSNTYMVKSGDTLYGIAKRFNTTVDKLKSLNNLKSDILTIGTILYLP